MDNIKEMPYDEKYERVLELKELVEDFAPKLVQRELGKEEADKLWGIWKKESEPLPADASKKERYEITYRNFLQEWVTAHDFMSSHHSESGEASGVKFIREAVNAWKRKYRFDSLRVKILWKISPKTAFRRMASGLAYQLQVFSPYKVSELNEDRMILTVAPCKILEVRQRNDFCVLACQNVLPAWLEAQFNVKMSPERQGTNCKVTLSPFT